MAYLERDAGKRIYFEDYGAGDSAVVLVHGWGASLRTWDFNLNAIRVAGHRVVLLDHRGCGSSDKDFSDFSVEAIAGDVTAMVDHLNLSKVILNGWSLGGSVVVQVAHDLGARCAGVFLTCGATPAYLKKSDYPHGGEEEALAATMEAMEGNRAEFLWGLTQGVAAKPLGDQTLHWIWQIFMEGSPAAGASLAALGPLDQRSILANLNCPILSCLGTEDVVVDPDIPRSVANLNANARTHEFEGCGHAPHMEDAAAYNKLLLEFISECG
ncbi:MAG: alpha/beta fold hydrolase [Pseudomonadales bacterium]|nr:alpha/beta fold hydrolase [Pseudomonadales bacterium]